MSVHFDFVEHQSGVNGVYGVWFNHGVSWSDMNTISIEVVRLCCRHFV